MTAVSETDAEATALPETFDSVSPITGGVVGTYRIDTAEDVAAAVERARAATGFWAGLDFDGRARRLLAWKHAIAKGIDELAAVVHRDTGKPIPDARLEIVLALDHIDWAAKNARKVLGPKKVRSTIATPDIISTVEYQQLGVVGVIGPWNYPVFTPMGSIAYALSAGNTVVFKPSEYSPGVGAWLVDRFAEVVPEADVFQLITGLGPTGAALCEAGVDKVAFTGSARTGKLVMRACSETLTPVVIEAGGKDPILVDIDADLDKAADAALWGAMSNAGQTCVGVERAYVHNAVLQPFLDLLVEKASGVSAGPNEKIGPITMPGQLDVIRRHIDDALDRGGRALVGGRDAIDGNYVQPTILVDVPEDSLAVREETFGPTITVRGVDNMDEAIELANDTDYGLGSTVFSKRRGVELARRIRSGMTAVNSVISFAAVPGVPFGGIGNSGFGRIHGPDGLREFTTPKVISRRRFPAPLLLTSFGRTARTDGLVRLFAKALHGRG